MNVLSLWNKPVCSMYVFPLQGLKSDLSTGIVSAEASVQPSELVVSTSAFKYRTLEAIDLCGRDGVN